MPETFDVDRACEALAHDVMDRAAPPSAFGAIKQARHRRRTALATAVAAAVVVAGVALPTLAGERLWVGFADGLPEPAPLNAAALTDATQGWINDWTRDYPTGGTYSGIDCGEDIDIEGEASRGETFYAGSQVSNAVALFYTFDSQDLADAAWDQESAHLLGCDAVASTGGPDYPEGTDVRHYAVKAAVADEAWVTDFWVARTGSAVSLFRTTSAAGVATDDAIHSVSDALVAGMLSGWSGVKLGSDDGRKAIRPQLPHADERELEAALGGWRNPARVDGAPLPRTPCYSAFAKGTGGSAGGMPNGSSFAIEGYAEPGPMAAQQVQSAVESLRTCDNAMTESALPGGVTLFTYDLGDDAGHGAIWLAGNEDRAMIVTLDGAATAMPTEVGPEVGEFIRSVLDLPWPQTE